MNGTSVKSFGEKYEIHDKDDRRVFNDESSCDKKLGAFYNSLIQRLAHDDEYGSRENYGNQNVNREIHNSQTVL